MAELIDTGATSTPIEPFDIRRFATGAASENGDAAGHSTTRAA
jgi:sarcosine oxidase subunit beta